MAQSRVVVDIETIGIVWDDFSDPEREYLTAHAKGDNDIDRAVDAQSKLALGPLTCNIVAIGLLNPDSRKGRIHLVAPTFAPGALAPSLAFDPCEVFPYFDELAALEAFWKDVRQYDQIITFNGRVFDGPVLMIRSMVHGAAIGRNLVPYRYSAEHHLDLFDQLSFYGAIRSPSLDFWCRRLGIDSPKEHGSGKDVGVIWRAGEYARLVRYLTGDLVAEAALLERCERVGLVPGPRNPKTK